MNEFPVWPQVLIAALFIGCSGETEDLKVQTNQGANISRSEGPPLPVELSQQQPKELSTKRPLIHDPKAAEMVGLTPEAAVERIAVLGSGDVRRATLRKSFHEAAVNRAVPIEVGIAILKEIDANGFPEDSLAIFGDAQRFVERLGEQESLELLSTLSSTSIRKTIATGFGRFLSESGVAPDAALLASVDEPARDYIYRAFGNEIVEQFSSAAEIKSFVASLDLNQEGHKAILESVYSGYPSRVDPKELLQLAVTEGDAQQAQGFFNMGMERLVRSDLSQASVYLSEQKDKLPRELYQSGVKKLIFQLQKFRDFEAAKTWEAELN